ncbi:unnamed protein product [Adineta steineri]|uniref:Uncharacterized protein n=1 Tax=Adineta steineri TaxID=433720 RepID=A0A813VR35_9BILA|nr:unnamed protein product [Adineta steineri]CAF3952935.1 unnamed protein product [Adineta steineri]
MADINSYFIVSMICLQTLYNCALSICGQYIYQYYLKTYPAHNWTNTSSFTINLYESVQETCAQNTTDVSNNSAEIWAQQRSADLIFQTTLWRAFPVIIITYLYGLYASRLNQKLVLLLSIIGNAIHVIIYQAIVYENLPEYWWYISAFIAGLAGGTNVLGIVMNLIITENTEENERSSRFVRLGALATSLSAISLFIIGYYIHWRGFTDLFWMAIGFEVLSILVVIFYAKPSRSSTTTIDETTSLLSSNNNNDNVDITIPTRSICNSCFDMCTIFNFTHNSRKKTINLILIIICYIFHLLATTSLSPLIWYLLGAPFCWSSEDLGNFSAISLISTAIFSVLGMKLFSYCGANDALICALGHICFFGYSLWIALAKYSWQLYLALLINPFSVYQNVLTVSMISKLLEPHERHNAFTLITEINTIILAFGSSLFNWMYARTVIYQKNFTLLFASGLCVIPFILNMYLYLITRKISTEEEITIVSEVDPEVTTPSLLSNILPQDGDTASLYCRNELWMRIYTFIMTAGVPTVMNIFINYRIYAYIRSSTRRIQPQMVNSITNTNVIPEPKINRRDIAVLKQIVFMILMFVCGWTPPSLIVIISNSVTLDPLIFRIASLFGALCLLGITINLIQCNHEFKHYCINNFRRVFFQ